MPFPDKGCSHSKPITVKVNSGSIRVRLIHPVKMAPTDSKNINKPKIILKIISGELSICLNKNLFMMVKIG
jgi:hypothetical protein